MKKTAICVFVTGLFSSGVMAESFVNILHKSEYIGKPLEWSEWYQVGESFNCTEWTPESTTVVTGKMFEQKRNCDQNQERSKGKAVENRVENVDETRDIYGTAVKPEIFVENQEILESDTDSIEKIKIKLSEATTVPVSVDYKTIFGTADNSDIESSSGSINFAIGEIEKEVSVKVKGDYTLEPHENFLLEISNPENGEIKDKDGLVTLKNNDVIYEFNTLPIYGIVEYNDGNGWSQVVANTEYSRIFDFRYNPTEEDVLAVSRDINVGSFDTDPSTPYYADGNHSMSDWGTVTGDTFVYNENGVTVSGKVADGDFIFLNSPGNATGVGLASSTSPGDGGFKDTSLTITLDGDFLNDIQITADGLGSCYDYANSCETKFQITAYDENDDVIAVQGSFRKPFDPTHGEAFINTYNFTGQTTIKKFLVEIIGTNEGGNNPTLNTGSNPILNMTVSRSAFEVMDYKMIDVDGNETTQTLRLNINEGNANTNIDLNNILEQ